MIDYRSVIPTNLYGPGDNCDLEERHVIPALIRKFHEAKAESASQVGVRGTGKPRREFLYVDDMAGSQCPRHAAAEKRVRNVYGTDAQPHQRGVR